MLRAIRDYDVQQLCNGTNESCADGGGGGQRVTLSL